MECLPSTDDDECGPTTTTGYHEYNSEHVGQPRIQFLVHNTNPGHFGRSAAARLLKK